VGIASRSDASHLPKFWGQSVQRFRRSIDWKFEVVSRVPRLCWFAPGGPSARSPRTVREVVADRPWVHRGPSARCLTAQLFFVFVRVLERLSFDPFCQWVFGAWSLRTVRTRVSDGTSRGGRSAGPSRTVRFSRCSTGGSGSIFGRSVPSSRTVRPDTAEGPPGAFQIA
jgi:hypothetical protein